MPCEPVKGTERKKREIDGLILKFRIEIKHFRLRQGKGYVRVLSAKQRDQFGEELPTPYGGGHDIDLHFFFIVTELADHIVIDRCDGQSSFVILFSRRGEIHTVLAADKEWFPDLFFYH